MEGLFTIEWIDEIFSGREGHMCVCVQTVQFIGGSELDGRLFWRIRRRNCPNSVDCNDTKKSSPNADPTRS